jgi:serine/threonine protein kinase
VNIFRFYAKDNDVLLEPDLCVYRANGDVFKLAAVVEVKTPWAFDLPTGKLVEAFETEKRVAAQRGDDDPSSKNRADTKVTRVVSQLWGYLSANHLRYGVITTFSQTYFFRRMESSSSSASRMEVTPAISLSSGPLPIYLAWFHFLTLLKDDFLYTSPFSSPMITRKSVKENCNQYEPIRIQLGQIYFDSPFAFGGSSSVTTGKISLVGAQFGNKSFVLKVFDGSKDPEAKELFQREILAYQLLESLQGKCIPQFYCALIASEFVFILVLEKIENTLNTILVSTQGTLKDAFRGIHSCGVIQNDVALRNVLISNGGFRVVDFGRALFHISHFKTGLSESVFLDQESFDNARAEELDQVKLIPLSKLDRQ